MRIGNVHGQQLGHQVGFVLGAGDLHYLDRLVLQALAQPLNVSVKAAGAWVIGVVLSDVDHGLAVGACHGGGRLHLTQLLQQPSHPDDLPRHLAGGSGLSLTNAVGHRGRSFGLKQNCTSLGSKVQYVAQHRLAQILRIVGRIHRSLKHHRALATQHQLGLGGALDVAE